MTFEEYLINKRINSEMFKTAEPLLWQEWNALFNQVSPNSFTVQKFYLINTVRRKYQLTVSSQNVISTVEQKPAAKPMMRSKPKM